MEDDRQLSFKFVLVGDSNVGKTAICRRFCENQFESQIPQTVGLEFGLRVIEIQNFRIKLQIWDTAGQEKFHSITRAYFRSATAVFLVFSVDSRDSFTHIGTWTDDCARLSPANAVKILIGNKTDLTAQRAVSTAEAQEFADQNGLKFFETSALSGDRIEDAFLDTAREVYSKFVDGKIDFDRSVKSETSGEVVKLSEERKGSGCCGG
jgi:small GTP-binding protein